MLFRSLVFASGLLCAVSGVRAEVVEDMLLIHAAGGTHECFISLTGPDEHIGVSIDCHEGVDVTTDDVRKVLVNWLSSRGKYTILDFRQYPDIEYSWTGTVQDDDWVEMLNMIKKASQK